VTDSKLYLFKEPVPLNSSDHGNLGLNGGPAPFDFARKATVLPMVASEVQTAQRDYPIIFSSLEKPALIAITGFSGASNLFVDEAGNWESNRYVPAYARRYPLAGIPKSEDNEEFLVYIDRQCERIVSGGDAPFFEGDELTSAAQEMVDFCGSYLQEARRTQQFCEHIAEMGLLGVREAVYNEEGGIKRTIAEYVCVEPERMAELKGDRLQQLYEQGYIAMIFAHLFSLENWARLDARVNAGVNAAAAG
jgi:hypothetical protein